MIWNTRLKEICFQKHTYCFSHEKFNLAHFKEPSFSAFPSRWAFKKYCKNCHIQCHIFGRNVYTIYHSTAAELYIYIAFRQIPHQSRICTRTIICHRKEQNSKLFCPQVITCFIFFIFSGIQVKPQIFKVLEHEISDEDGNELCIWDILVCSAKSYLEIPIKSFF